MACFLTSVLLIVTTLIIGAVYFVRRQYAFWKNAGVPCVPPTFPLGNLTGVGTKLHISEKLQLIYNEMKNRGPFVGLYFFVLRVVLLTDLDLVKNVMIKDSHLFIDRRVYYNEKDDPLSAHLFSFEGAQWKKLRTKLTPTFTSGKMKFMFNTVADVGERLVRRLNEVVNTTGKEATEIKDFWARYTTDVIGSCAFGLECNTLNAQNSEFREMGRVLVEEPRHSPLVNSLLAHWAWIGRLFRIKLWPNKPTDFFMGIVKETIAYRDSNKDFLRKDFMSILLDLRKSEQNINGQTLSTEEIAGQAFLFFIAGFETSSSLLSFCSYELAINTDIQERTRQEIKDVLARHNGQFTYEAMMEMTYCEQVLNEALRKYPPLATLTRIANKDYTVPGTNYVIPEGVSVMIPAYAIQNDPDIYPDPEKFDPERFSAEGIRNRHPLAFLAFGDGPRNCIGLRFGLMQARIGLVSILLNFRFTLDSRMSIPLRLIKNQFIIASDEGIWLKMEKI